MRWYILDGNSSNDRDDNPVAIRLKMDIFHAFSSTCYNSNGKALPLLCFSERERSTSIYTMQSAIPEHIVFVN